jgi:hypothetical protein
MAIKFPGELIAPYKPTEMEASSVAVSAVGGVEKYGEVSGIAVTGYLPLTGGTLTGGLTMNTNLTFGSGSRNIILSTTNGTKIGTATTQLLGFYNAAPVDQPATVSDAVTQDIAGANTVDEIKVEADLTSCKNAINAIIDRLQELGLIA